jgi:hypothetical protein
MVWVVEKLIHVADDDPISLTASPGVVPNMHLGCFCIFTSRVQSMYPNTGISSSQFHSPISRVIIVQMNDVHVSIVPQEVRQTNFLIPTDSVEFNHGNL